MAEIIIRPYRSADQEDVVQLWKTCDLVVPWNDPVKDIEFKLQVDAELLLVAEYRGRPIGTAMGGYEGHRGWLYYLAVHPDFRRRGLGRRLVEEVEARLTERGCPKVNLMVRKTNSLVIDFYHSLGFTENEVVCLGKMLKKRDSG